MDYVWIEPHKYVWPRSKGSFSLEEYVGKLSLLCLERRQISQLHSFSFMVGIPLEIDYFWSWLRILNGIWSYLECRSWDSSILNTLWTKYYERFRLLRFKGNIILFSGRLLFLRIANLLGLIANLLGLLKQFTIFPMNDR